MNYIAEINSFYNWLIENNISGNAQALWHRLMAYNNQLCWKNEFSIANSRLYSELNISRQELDRVRNVLVQKGLISYKKGNGKVAGIYTIIPFNSQYVTPHITSDVTSDVTQSGQLTSTLNKQNKTKQKNKEEKNNKKSFGNFNNVLLTEEELNKLKAQFADYNDKIENLSAYIASTGKKYKDHYATILCWDRKDGGKNASCSGNTNRSANNTYEGVVYLD